MPIYKSFIDKIKYSKELIADSIKKYKNIAVGCSFGKDSIVLAHIARQVDKNIPIFSVMTIFKPKETLQYLVDMNKRMNLGVRVYMAASQIPAIFKETNIETILLPAEQFEKSFEECQNKHKKPLYEVDPDLCCSLLKVEPTKEAVKDLDAWVAGLRKSEGSTRADLDYVIHKGNIVKINPILDFTELDIWRYLAINQIPANPLYARGYRSLGCAPCSKIVSDQELERAGRWQGTSKCQGECGIHSKILK